jgi:hypothetical protein
MNCMIVNCVLRTLHQILLGYEDRGEEIGGTCSTHDKDEKGIQILDGKPIGKTPFGKLRRTCKDNIKVDLKKW